MKNFYYLLLLITIISCSKSDTEMEPISHNEAGKFYLKDQQKGFPENSLNKGAEAQGYSHITLTKGPEDPYICQSDSGFLKDGDIEVIIDSPATEDIIITYNVYKYESGSYRLVPPLPGGGSVAIRAGDTRGTSIICDTEIFPFVGDACDGYNGQIYIRLKFEIDKIAGIDVEDYQNITVNDNNIIGVTWLCPYSGGGGGFN